MTITNNASTLIALSLFVFLSEAGAYTVPSVDGPVVVNNFGYQLQKPGGLDYEDFAAAPHNLIVTDFARFGNESNKFTPSQVNSMQQSEIALGGDGQRKSVVSYLSIGEASEFRTYWDDNWTVSGDADSPLTASAPSWLGATNPAWPESRKTRYWDTGWQEIIFNEAKTGWLDQIVDQGFDGAYLDIVDAYYYWGAEVGAVDQIAGDPIDVQDSARRMIDFVVDFTAHARETNPSFFVIPQNGEFILSDLIFGGPNSETADIQRRADYLDAIAAIGIEDTYYRGNSDENNAFNPDNSKINVLKNDFLAAGKPVLVTDYLSDTAKVANFELEARADGFIPYAAPTRGLDSLGSPAADLLPGDYDGDGDVDTADYNEWAAAFGSTLLLASDGNNNGVIDAADYTVWRDNLSSASASNAVAVPEPSSIVLFGIFFTNLVLVRDKSC